MERLIWIGMVAVMSYYTFAAIDGLRARDPNGDVAYVSCVGEYDAVTQEVTVNCERGE